MKNYYNILNIDITASASKINSQFKKLSSETHPIKTNDSSTGQIERFVSIVEAYVILSDENGKKIYDSISKSDKTLTDFINGDPKSIWTKYAKSLSAKIISANRTGHIYSKKNYKEFREDFNDYNWWDIISALSGGI